MADDYRTDDIHEKMSRVGFLKTTYTLFNRLKSIETERQKSLGGEVDESSLTDASLNVMAAGVLAAFTLVGMLVSRLFNKQSGEEGASESVIPTPEVGVWSTTISKLKSLVFPEDTPLPESKAPLIEPTPGSAPAVPLPKIDLSKVPDNIQSAIAEASRLSGISQPVLYAIANKESRLGKYTIAATSSARGLFQLIPSTYKELVGKYGKQLGIGVKDIDSPRANAIMGALYLRQLAETYRKNMQTSPTVTQLYLMYMLGPSGGLRFFKRMQEDATAKVADDMPVAAANNFSVFYDRGPAGPSARSYSEVVNFISREVGDVSTSITKNYPSLAGPADTFAPVPESNVTVKPPSVLPVMGSSNTSPIQQGVQAPPQLVPIVETSTPAAAPDPKPPTIIPGARNQKPQTILRLENGMVVYQ
jgi:hypothetical protein